MLGDDHGTVCVGVFFSVGSYVYFQPPSASPKRLSLAKAVNMVVRSSNTVGRRRDKEQGKYIEERGVTHSGIYRVR